MHTYTSIYKSSVSVRARQRWALGQASSLLLTLVALQPVQAQDVQGIEIDPSQLMRQRAPAQQASPSQSASQQAPAPLSEGALQIIANVIKNLSPTGKELVLSKSYTPEQRQQILSYMQSQAPQTQSVPQESKPSLPTLEQQRQLMLGKESEAASPAKEEIKQTEKPTLEQQKQLALMQPSEQQKQIEKAAPEQTKEQIKQVEKLTPEQQKQLLLTQQQEQQKQLEQIQTQQGKEEIRQVEKPVLEQTKQILPTKQTGLPVATPASPASIAQEKYQKLLDAGIFSAGSSMAPVLDATMTRAQFAAIASKLQEMIIKSGGTFSDIPSSLWGEQTGALTIGTIEGLGKQTITVISDDKKSSADFLELLAALNKGKMSQEELDKLIKKLGSMNPTNKPAASLRNGDIPILGAIQPVEQIVAPPGGTAAVTTGITGIITGGLTGIQTALAAAQAAAIAASSNANNITLANAVTVGADYTMVTPRANFPTNLNATFNGRMSGTLSDSSAVGANLTMNVNFANIGSGTPIGGNVQFDNNKGSASFNSVAYLGGYVGGGMSGTYNGEAMNGFIRNGQFFGPAANAVKGSWDMTTNSVSGGGSFAATR
jgi:chemotaxis protein histidine kinase CheA